MSFENFVYRHLERTIHITRKLHIICNVYDIRALCLYTRNVYMVKDLLDTQNKILNRIIIS